MDKMRSRVVLFLIVFFLIASPVCASNITMANKSVLVNQTLSVNQTNPVNLTPTLTSTDGSSGITTTSDDQQFLFLMNQYWIPDFFDIKGRLDGAAGFGSDVPQMLNLSADYAKIRLMKNINETNGYNLSSAVSGLKNQYQTGAIRSIDVINSIMVQNRSAEGFAQDVPMRTAALSLYGSWLEYQVMRCYHLPNITYPEIATVPPDKFMEVMGVITS